MNLVSYKEFQKNYQDLKMLNLETFVQVKPKFFRKTTLKSSTKTKFATAIKTLSIIFAMFGKFGSAICTSSIYTITVELYPTVLR